MIAFSLVNCGPASLAMVLAAFGLDVDPPSLRDYLNRLVGNYDTEQGTSLYALAQIAREAGLNVFGPSGRGGYQSWTIDAIHDQIRAGHPVITLTKYRRLPGHFSSVTDFDHCIVITGLAGADFVYNDGAFSTEYGYNLIITSAEFERAWADSSIPVIQSRSASGTTPARCRPCRARPVVRARQPLASRRWLLRQLPKSCDLIPWCRP